MLSFKELKKNAKNNLKKHFFRNIIVAFISLLIINGGYTYLTSNNDNIVEKSENKIANVKEINKSSKSNSELINEIITNSKKDIDDKKESTIKKEKGIENLIVNELTKSKSFFLGFLNSINKIIFKGNYEIISIISLVLILYFIYTLFIKYPITIGKNRYFMEKSNYEDTKVEKLFFTYKIRKSINISFKLLLKNIYQLLWNLTIIGGVIKYYSYFLVPYILTENPNIKSHEAIKLSCNMMKGYKFKLFLLKLTFIPWQILSLITINFSDILYFNPYKELIYCEFYFKLKDISKKENIDKIDLLNDDLLLNNFDKKIYPEEYLENKFSSLSIFKELNYDRNYSLLSLILLFFTFSIVGYLWEVMLHIVETGNFVNRGTMFGPWLPIYGFGGIFILILLKPVRKNPWKTFIFAFIICGLVEYFTGWYLETFKHMKWWDYTGYILNINGRVCIEGLIVFGLAGCCFTYVFAPLLDNLYSKIKPNIKKILCTILIILYITDLIYSHNNPNTGKGITNEITKIINPLGIS